LLNVEAKDKNGDDRAWSGAINLNSPGLPGWEFSMRSLLISAFLVVGWPLAPPGFGQSVEEDERESVQAEGKPAKAGPDLDRVARTIVERTNAFRKKEGRPEVKMDPKLVETARYFAGYMARTDEYGHKADGKRPAERAEKHGYDYCLISENIAYVFDSRGYTAEKMIDQFVTGWKESPGHRKNMLDPDVTETGVAVARSEKTGYYYAVQMFGRPKSQAIEFRIDNQSGETVEYKIGEKSFTLPPRYVRTHTRCRSSELTFRWPGDAGTATVKPTAGDRLVVRKSDKGYDVVKE
jgi:uncharacterized protein YkwD